jgi:hypothetical protein
MKSALPVPCKPWEDLYGYDETISSDNLCFLLSASAVNRSISICSSAPIARDGGILYGWQFNPGRYISAAVQELD